ncbi:hypothetical protein [Allorhizocola rhizosphaerae]|uniref:hypothetical protein n=1 Tax=Allorhizocola rhizosphaerae TaxID=1872709 RepID=UPI0013C37726|nr:hypothetical protein [Allorhizocola rhizosphaerae]
MEIEVGLQRRASCPFCQTVVGGPNQEFAVTNNKHQVLMANLTTASTQVVATLPKFERVRLLAQADGWVLAAAVNPEDVSAYGGPETVYAVRLADGHVEERSADSDTSLEAAGAGTTVFGGSWFAVVTTIHAGRCQTRQNLELLEVGSANQVTVKPPQPKDLPEGGNSIVFPVWGSDGHLYAIHNSCSSDDKQVEPSKPALWRLEKDHSWTQIKSGSFEAAAPLDGKTTLVTVRDTKTATIRLQLERDSGTETVADNIRTFAVRPADH